MKWHEKLSADFLLWWVKREHRKNIKQVERRLRQMRWWRKQAAEAKENARTTAILVATVERRIAEDWK